MLSDFAAGATIARSFGGAASGPGFRAGRPLIERSGPISVLPGLGRSHDPRIDERRGHVGDLRIVGIAGHDHSDPVLARKRDEVGMLETLVADLDHVADREPIDRFGQ